jgi:hypothetical protein
MMLVFGMAGAAWYPQKVNVPVTNYDNITLVDDKYMFFGTGTDASLRYDSAMDMIYLNDTPIYLEEAVTAGNGITASLTGTVDGIDIDDVVGDAYTNETAINSSIDALTVAAYTNETAINSSISSLTTAAYTNESAINTSVSALTTAAYTNETAINSSISSLTTAAYTNETAINLSIVDRSNALVNNAYTNETAINSSISDLEMPLVVSFTANQITDGEINQTVFISNGAWQVVSVEEVQSAAESTLTTLNVTVVKVTGTNAVSAGTNITTETFNLKGAADTIQTGTVNSTVGTLADGNRIGLWCRMTGSSAPTEFKAGHVTIHMKRL